MLAESVDLIITDPPFAINFNSKQSSYNRKKSNVLQGYDEIQPQDYYDFSVSWLREAYRVLRENGSMYVCSGWTHLRDILNALHETGWHDTNHFQWKVPVWRFYQSSICHVTLYDNICVQKRQKKKNFIRIPGLIKTHTKTVTHSIMQTRKDVWVIPREYWRGQTKTPTKLPGALVEKMLAYSSTPGDNVMDPFAGSGQVGVYARQTKRKFTGFEIVPEYCRFANDRIRNTRVNITG